MYLFKILYIAFLVFIDKQDIRKEINIEDLNDDMNYLIDNLYSYIITKINYLHFDDIRQNPSYSIIKHLITNEEKELFTKNYMRLKEEFFGAKNAITSIINTNNVGLIDIVFYNLDNNAIAFITDVLYDIKYILTEKNETIAIRNVEILKDRLITNNTDVDMIINLVCENMQFYIEGKDLPELTNIELMKIFNVIGPLFLDDIKSYIINLLNVKILPNEDEKRIDKIIHQLIDNMVSNIEIYKKNEITNETFDATPIFILIISALITFIIYKFL